MEYRQNWKGTAGAQAFEAELRPMPDQ